MSFDDDEDEKVDPTQIISFNGEPTYMSYNTRDLLIYSLGIGCCSTTEQIENELQFVYENHENFSAFPTFILVLPFKGLSHDIVPFPAPSLMSFPPGLPMINPALILHAEQSLRILRPLNIEGERYSCHTKILGIYNKGKGALLRTQQTFIDENNEPVAISVNGTYFRGLTNFESKGEQLPEKIRPKKNEKPDSIIELKTKIDQALIYRLSGDYNPLHADPDIAESVGFEQPILHGLSTLGHATRAIYQKYCQNNIDNLKYIEVRFSKPTIPGQTLVTYMWKRNNNTILFKTLVKETNDVVLDAGIAEIDNLNLSKL